jgi:hypothetical protein
LEPIHELFNRARGNGPHNGFRGEPCSLKAISNRLRAAGHSAGADQGNIAVIFAFVAIPILTFVGAAIDCSRANKARSSMQSALDPTAPMLAKETARLEIIAGKSASGKSPAIAAGLFVLGDR